jgi:hypothetical protein
MKTWLKRIGIAALCVVVVVCAITYVRFTGGDKKSPRISSVTVRLSRLAGGRLNMRK